QAAVDLGLTPDKGVRVRLTGSVPMADEEFATLAQGAGRNALITIAAVAVLLWLGLPSGRHTFSIPPPFGRGPRLTRAVRPAARRPAQSHLSCLRRAVRGARGRSRHPVYRALSRRTARLRRSGRRAPRCRNRRGQFAGAGRGRDRRGLLRLSTDRLSRYF